MYTIYSNRLAWIYQNEKGVTVYVENVSMNPAKDVYNVDIGHDGRTLQKRLVTRCTRLWKIDGGNLEPLKIPAETFDEALAIARKINRNYNGGQVIR